MPAPDKIIQLIEKFDKFYKQLHSPDYNETELRIEYINPLFAELGWDIDNERGYSQAYREVIHEAKMKKNETTKRPDYAFRIGGTAKFYVETKKPAVNIDSNPNPALQLRSYIWTAKLPLGILTDFEEFAVYDGRIKPNKNDKASTARIFYINYRDYPQKWDKIKSIFAKESILQGSFDEFVKSSKAKKGTSDVDDEFLKEITRWREMLAKNIALRNKNLSTRELNYVVQKTIDRIIFLRIAEDREIEEEFQLRKLLDGKNVYQRLQKIYWQADDKYNSGLFHFRPEQGRTDAPDNISTKIKIDDSVLKDIIKHLYYPDCPYAFAVMPADILGQVYEQFLGKVIRLTKGHQAKVEDKPEVKKAGGVYYTPTYIVDYIVENTLGKLLKEGLENKSHKSSSKTGNRKKLTPDDVAKIKILDPACGSGSFLIGAYQKLLDWHLDWYSQNNPEKWAKGEKPRIYRIAKNDWMLTTAEKKRILLNNIYGVDIDSQAVEVTKLSLLLKVLENENKETIGKQLSLFKERALPDLANNIKCGNSLIGSDFYEGKQSSLFDIEEQYRINALDWEKEFPQVFRRKQLKAYHITWVTHNSRVSERMVHFGVKRGEPFILEKNLRNDIYNYLAEKILKENYKILALNVLDDHVHCIVVCEENELGEIVRNLKGYSSYSLSRQLRDRQLKQSVDTGVPVNSGLQPVAIDNESAGIPVNSGLHPSAVDGRGRQSKIWAKGYSHTYIDTDEHLRNSIFYINNNHKKHGLAPIDRRMIDIQLRDRQLKQSVDTGVPVNSGLQRSAISTIEEAFTPQYAGGFDVVIGNPPYVNIENLEEHTKKYFFKHYATCKGRTDIYIVFIEKALKLIKQNGLLSFIIPYAFTKQIYGTLLREKLIRNYFIKEIVDTSNFFVFKQANVKNIIISIEKNISHGKTKIKTFVNENDFENSIFSEFYINQNTFLRLKDYRFETKPVVNLLAIKEKIWNVSVSLDSICFVAYGARLNHKTQKIGKKHYIHEDYKKGFKPFLEGKNIERYSFTQYGWLDYKPDEHYNSMFPELFENEKIMFINVVKDRLRFAYDNRNFYNSHTVINCIRIDKLENATHIFAKKIFKEADLNFVKNYDLKFLLGILNSNLINWYFISFQTENIHFYPNDAKNLPIRTIDFSNPDDVAKHDRMVSLVEQMLDVQKKIADAKIPYEKEMLERMRDAIDEQIDKLVYELYGLTEEEIRIVEGKGKNT